MEIKQSDGPVNLKVMIKIKEYLLLGRLFDDFFEKDLIF